MDAGQTRIEGQDIIGNEASLCNDAMTKHATVQNGSFASAVNNNPTHESRFGPTTTAPFGIMPSSTTMTFGSLPTNMPVFMPLTNANLSTNAVLNNAYQSPWSELTNIPQSVSKSMAEGGPPTTPVPNAFPNIEDFKQSMIVKSMEALDSVLRGNIQGVNLDGLKKLNIPVPANFVSDKNVRTLSDELELKDIQKVVPVEKCNAEYLAEINDSIMNLSTLLDVIARTCMERILRLLEIGNGGNGWICSTSELTQALKFVESVSCDDCGIASKAAYACSIFQKQHNNAYGKKVMKWVQEKYGVNFAATKPGGTAHFVVRMAKVRYDRVGHPVLNGLRSEGYIFWTLNEKRDKKDKPLEKVGDSRWGNQMIYFYKNMAHGSTGECEILVVICYVLLF